MRILPCWRKSPQRLISSCDFKESKKGVRTEFWVNVGSWSQGNWNPSKKQALKGRSPCRHFVTKEIRAWDRCPGTMAASIAWLAEAVVWQLFYPEPKWDQFSNPSGRRMEVAHIAAIPLCELETWFWPSAIAHCPDTGTPSHRNRMWPPLDTEPGPRVKSEKVQLLEEHTGQEAEIEVTTKHCVSQHTIIAVVCCTLAVSLK